MQKGTSLTTARVAHATEGAEVAEYQLASVSLSRLMAVTTGRQEVAVALLDGPVARGHPELVGARIRAVSPSADANCAQPAGVACVHGTFVAGILVAKRQSAAPGICQNCTLLVRPIFSDDRPDQIPSASPGQLAEAIIECVDAGARVLNVSAGISDAPLEVHTDLGHALDYAAVRGAIVVAASGNQAAVGASSITLHPSVIAVVAYGNDRKPLDQANLGRSIGRRGLGAPGEDVTSLGVDGSPLTFSGSSVAVPFVSGTLALLWSEFPHAQAVDIKRAVTQIQTRRKAIVPPLLDAWDAYRSLLLTQEEGG